MIVLTDKQKIPFQIDEDDYEAISRYSWRIHNDGYPETWIGKRGTLWTIRLHVFLLGRAGDGLEWDHVNRDPLDNRRCNLRAITHTANTRNATRRKDNTSGVRGVSFRRTAKRPWQAYIGGKGANGRRGMVHLGFFESLEQAIAARQTAERELWGSA